MKTETKTEALGRVSRAALFKKYRPMAHRFAQKFARTYQKPLAEVAAEAESELALIASQWNDPGFYNPSKCSVTSWMYRRLYWGLLTTYSRKQDKAMTFTRAMEEDGLFMECMGHKGTSGVSNSIEIPAKQSWLEKLRHNLGEDARIIVETILFAPAELLEDLTHRRAKSAITRHLADKGWEEKRVEQAWNEVEAAL